MLSSLKKLTHSFSAHDVQCVGILPFQKIVPLYLFFFQSVQINSLFLHVIIIILCAPLTVYMYHARVV